MNIIITGASRGIGLEMVKHFASNKENRVVAVSRNIKPLENISKSNNVYPLSLDLTTLINDETILSDFVYDIFSNTDIIINNAGYLKAESFTDSDINSAIAMFNVNYFGLSQVIKSMYESLKKSENPHIVNISSMGGFQGSAKFAGLAHYSASKAAVASLTEVLAEEFKEDNIKVNALALGAVETEMLNEAFPGYKAPVCAKEMAEFICNFAQNTHKYINGKVIPVSLSTP